MTSPCPWQVGHLVGLEPVGRARAVAARAQHGGIHPQRLGRTECRLGKLKIEANQGVLATAYPRSRSARGVLAEHRVDQVGEVEATRAEAAVEATDAAAERVAAAVVEVALLGILEYLVRLGDALESLGRIRLLGHVGMQLHRELAIGLLDLLGCRISGYAEDLVVVRAHAGCAHPSERNRPT